MAIIQGDIYRIRAELFYGTGLIVCSPLALDIILQQPTRPGQHLVVENLLPNSIEGLTIDLAHRLSSAACDEILQAYGQAFLTFSRLRAALGASRGGTDAPYIEEAIHDLGSASESMLTARPSYGQSKWDSLQAVEKLIKSCILEKGKVHKNTHHLADLFALAEGLGVPKTDPSLIALVQCPPSVRYDAATVTKIEAFSAHGAALKICGDLALNVKRTTAHSEVSDYEFQFYHTKLRGLNLRHAPPAPPFIFVGWKYPAELLPNDVPALESIGNVACLYRPMIGASRP